MEPTRIQVSLGARSYEVAVGERLIRQLREYAESAKPTSTFIITDSNVGPLHAKSVRETVVANDVITVPAGENSKSLDTLRGLYDQVFDQRKLDRHSLIVALGGGMVGDLAGYLAATLMRGIRYVHIPTSLLAMVDSSVGGKTAINHVTGKNLIGAFHQPSAVFCDLHFLQSLPDREYISALAEIVKTGALSGPELTSLLETSIEKLLARDSTTLQKVVTACIQFKADVVAEDELESTGRRATLNLGHTLAHALETIYPERYLHGEAVAIGTAAALCLSCVRAGLDKATADRVTSLLQKLKLPVDPPAELDAAEMLEVMKGDKKRVGVVVRFVSLVALGEPGALPCKLDDELADILLGRVNA